MPRARLEELRVHPEDGRVYDWRGLAERLGGEAARREWERCTPAAEHPAAAFAAWQLGLAAGPGLPGCSDSVCVRVPVVAAPVAGEGEEARFDAHDDAAYTWRQLLERYAREYSEAEIQAYWDGLPPWWRPPEFGCASRSHFALARNLCLLGVIRSARVLHAVLATDRAHYAPAPALAYREAPQELGENATLSAPRIHCCCLEAAAPCCPPGAAVLDVGCGTGYTTAALARLVGPTGRVVGLDVVEEHVRRAERNIRGEDARLWGAGSIRLRVADGWWGSEQDGPFDCIHVACSCPRVPEPLVAQLRDGGRLVLPLGPPTPEWQSLTVVTKAGAHGSMGSLRARVIRPVRYVTMVHPPPRAGGTRSDALPAARAPVVGIPEWEAVD